VHHIVTLCRQRSTRPRRTSPTFSAMSKSTWCNGWLPIDVPRHCRSSTSAIDYLERLFVAVRYDETLNTAECSPKRTGVINKHPSTASVSWHHYCTVPNSALSVIHHQFDVIRWTTFITVSFSLKPRPHQQQCRSNIPLCRKKRSTCSCSIRQLALAYHFSRTH